MTTVQCWLSDHNQVHKKFVCSVICAPLSLAQPHEVCSPSFARGQTSKSHCMELMLLRLQSIWLSKLITSGLLIPAGRIIGEYGYRESAEVIGKITILYAYAIIASGHLPVVFSLVPFAVLGEGFLLSVPRSRYLIAIVIAIADPGKSVISETQDIAIQRCDVGISSCDLRYKAPFFCGSSGDLALAIPNRW